MKHFVLKFAAVMSLASSFLFTTGCAELPLVLNASEAIKYALTGAPDTEINRETINKVPYASISAKIGSGPRSFLVLGKQENSREHWFSADGAVIVTKYGRITQTAGFPENLRRSSSNGDDPVNRMLHLKKYGNETRHLVHIRTIDMVSDMEKRFGVPIRSEFETLGPKEIQIAGIKIKSILVRETNKAFTINWSYTNLYWVDAYDGFIWKSRQHIARNFPPIDIEVLKPAAQAH